MKIKYEPEVDAAYISFKKGPTQVTTIRITERGSLWDNYFWRVKV